MTSISTVRTSTVDTSMPAASNDEGDSKGATFAKVGLSSVVGAAAIGIAGGLIGMKLGGKGDVDFPFGAALGLIMGGLGGATVGGIGGALVGASLLK